MSRRSREEEEEEGRSGKRSSCGGVGKWSGVESFVDDAASEDEEEEEEEEDDDEDYVGGGGRARKRKRASIMIDDTAQVDDEEEEDGELEDGFIDDARVDGPDQDVGRSSRRHPPSMLDEEEDVDALVKRIHDRYTTHSSHFVDDGEDVTEVEQQALLPSVKDPKLWMVKCAIGHERETAICLMQKSIDTPDLQIKSVLALDLLKNHIYVEAYKESHVKEACKGPRNISASRKVTLVPIREMADVLSVQSKSVDISIDAWVRMKLGAYKGDLAKVVDVDDMHQKVTVKLIPRIDLQALANKFDGLKVVKEKKSFVPPPKLFSANEAREMNIRVDWRRNRDSGEYYEMVDGLKFKDGFLHKTFSIKSISTHNIQPSLMNWRNSGNLIMT